MPSPKRAPRFLRPLIIAAALLALPSAHAQAPAASSGAPTPTKSEIAFDKFWAAASPEDAAKVTDEIAASGISFDDAYRLLRAGRTYTAQKTGIVMLQNKTSDGVEHYYAVNIPADYTPAKHYQLRVQLHGGVDGRADNKPRGTGDIGALAGEGVDQIYVLPYAWYDEPWWASEQVMNINTILDSLKRTYNIDENRVVLSGVSDGGTGTYFIAMRDTTPFASFLPLNGFYIVLTNSLIEDHLIFPNNLRNKPLFVVNGGRDKFYPIAMVEPFTNHLMHGGVTIDYHPQPDAEHNTKWWPELEDLYEKFVADHPRDPNPDHLTWEAADQTHNRAHWLVLDEFGTAKDEAKEMPDLNIVAPPEEATMAGFPDHHLFEAALTAGRVDLVRTGNTVEATTHGVTAFTLLLSPDVFDFDQPIKVIANGHEMFNAKVPRNLKTLLKWAARDNDRRMLYAAEIQIKLPH
jgi:predicted esterase